VLRKSLRAGPALALVLLCHAPAFADMPRPLRLDYQRLEGAAACADAAAIRAGVTSRLGYDPFSEEASDRMRVTIRERHHLLEARIELVDAQGELAAGRRLAARGRDCGELTEAVELAMAIAIDPVLAGPAPPAEKPLAQASASALGPPLRTEVDAGMLGSLGWLPAANLGLRAGVRLRGEVLSLGLEARADLPAAKPLRAGEASGWLLAGTLLPCMHLRAASACALATAGALHVAGQRGLANPRQATLPYLGFGFRLAALLPIGERASLALHGDVTAPVTEARLTVDGEVVWRSPTVALTLGLGMAYRFP
jgi:hypothetical protein